MEHNYLQMDKYIVLLKIMLLKEVEDDSKRGEGEEGEREGINEEHKGKNIKWGKAMGIRKAQGLGKAR